MRSAVVSIAALLLTCCLLWIAIRSSPEPLAIGGVERPPRALGEGGARDGSPLIDEPQASRPLLRKPPWLIPNPNQADQPVIEAEFRRDWRTTEAYRQGYRDGVKEADLQFKKGRATFYTYGLRTGSSGVDKETGLPLEAIAGCLIDPRIVGRADGHENRVKELLRVHGDPPNSVKRWPEELLDLNGFVHAQGKTTKPLGMKAGGPPAVSTDGEVTVRPLRVEHVSASGNRSHQLDLAVEVKGRTLASLDVGAWDYEEVDLFWGPERSGFAMVRVDAGGSYLLRAFSLSDGHWLRAEKVRKRGR